MKKPLDCKELLIYLIIYTFLLVFTPMLPKIFIKEEIPLYVYTIIDIIVLAAIWIHAWRLGNRL